MRETVAARATRRRIPSTREWEAAAWVWEPSAAERAAAPAWIGFAFAAVLVAGAAARTFWRPDPVAEPRTDEVLWIEEASLAPQAGPTTPTAERSTDRRGEPEPPAVPSPPLPPAEAPGADDPGPVFSSDEATTTGALAVASGGATGAGAEDGPQAPVPATRAEPGALAVGSVPASVHPVVPRYPPRAEALGQEATVEALVTTDTLGDVVELRIVRSGGREFDESVRRAVLATRFRVPVVEGRPRAVAFRLPYRFRLE